MNDSSKLDVPVLETGRLRLRRLRMDDAPALLEILSDDDAVRYWGRPKMTRLETAEKYTRENLDWMEQGHCLYWAVEDLVSGKMIGTYALLRLDIDNRRAEVGYLLHRDWWHKGFMSEAMQRVIDYAFDDLKLHRLEADTDPANAASIRLLERFGFEREGVFKDRWCVAGVYTDSLMFGLITDRDSE